MGIRAIRGRLLPPTAPQRAMVLANFVNYLGNGLFNSAAVLYFTLVVHLGARQVGLGLTVAGLVGLAAGIPAGALADRRGPHGITVATLGIQAAATAAFLTIHSVVAFTLVACVDRIGASANYASRGALIGRVGGANPTAFRGRLRAFGNAGVMFGTLGAGLAIASGTHAAYAALMTADALSFVVCALILLRVPSYPPRPRPAEHDGWNVLADRPFITFAALDGAMGLQYQVVSLLLPLWIVFHTRAPHWTVAAAFAINSGVCVLLQTRIGAGVTGVREGGRALRHAGLTFLASCPLFAVAADVPGGLAPVVILAAIGVHGIGEIWQSSANIALGFGLAPEHAQGRYQGTLGLGFDAGQALAPALLTTVVLGLGQTGWLALGLFFAALGTLGPAVTEWAERTPPRVAAPETAPQ